MKKKFGKLNFDSIETLSRKEQSKIVGGYSGGGSDGTSCSMSCEVQTQYGKMTMGCYKDAYSVKCLCLDRNNNKQCN